MQATPNPLSTSEPWELVAVGYAAELDFMMRPYAQKAAELLPLSADTRVLDVAAGPGTFTLEVAPRVASVDAIDFSQQMIVQLRTSAERRQVHNVRTRVGDGQALPYPDSSYDVAVSLFGLMFFPDRDKGFRELQRTLRPQGTALVSSWAPAEESNLMRAMFAAIKTIDPTFVAPQKSILGLDNPEVLKRELEHTGFGNVRVLGHTHRMTEHLVASDVWRRFERGNAALVLMRKRMGEDAWQARESLAIAAIERELDSGMALETSAWFGIGEKIA
ncbi:MAG TPA: methyltransferase domain-containing protein [Polyangiaceae bacterium]|jgi:ubiquinone/menaquinone biosynthesis C-methylase UbiE|nr:methyltransferase domain-containing protein [Polyangiaceae bacterium]